MTPEQCAEKLSVLTQDEEDVLRLAASGMEGAAIAKTLGIGESLVRRHRTSLLRKLGVNLYACCCIAGRAGWV